MPAIVFTGTRLGMSKAQKERVRHWLHAMKPTTIIHGGCCGADWDLHVLAMLHREHVSHEVVIDVYPSDVRNTFPKGIKKLLERRGVSLTEKLHMQPALTWLELGASLAHPVARPLVRDRRMVDMFDEIESQPHCLLATVSTNKGEAWRSGTWATVNYARKASTRSKGYHVPIVIIRPNGTYELENFGVPHAPPDYFEGHLSR